MQVAFSHNFFAVRRWLVGEAAPLEFLEIIKHLLFKSACDPSYHVSMFPAYEHLLVCERSQVWTLFIMREMHPHVWKLIRNIIEYWRPCLKLGRRMWDHVWINMDYRVFRILLSLNIHVCDTWWNMSSRTYLPSFKTSTKIKGSLTLEIAMTSLYPITDWV